MFLAEFYGQSFYLGYLLFDDKVFCSQLTNLAELLQSSDSGDWEHRFDTYSLTLVVIS
jgi:hypothetical protein